MTPTQKRDAALKLWDLLEEATKLLWECFEDDYIKEAQYEIAMDDYLEQSENDAPEDPSWEELPF